MLEWSLLLFLFALLLFVLYNCLMVLAQTTNQNSSLEILLKNMVFCHKSKEVCSLSYLHFYIWLNDNMQNWYEIKKIYRRYKLRCNIFRRKNDVKALPYTCSRSMTWRASFYSDSIFISLCFFSKSKSNKKRLSLHFKNWQLMIIIIGRWNNYPLNHSPNYNCQLCS